MTQYLGEIFYSVFQVFPSFLHFETQKYLHVLCISIKKENLNSIASIIDEMAGCKNPEYKCWVYRLPQYYDSDWQSSHVSPLLYYVCTRWDTQKKIKSACPKSKKLTQFTSLWWGSKKLAQPAFSQLFFLTSHKTLLYHWATCKENNTKAQLMFCQPFIAEKFLLGSS